MGIVQVTLYGAKSKDTSGARSLIKGIHSFPLIMSKITNAFMVPKVII